MKEGMFNVSQLYDATYSGSYPTGTAVFSNVGKDGNATTGNNYYAANCTICHGTDGTALALEGKTLGAFVRSKPNESQHKIRYGQLGTSMVGKFNITLSQMKDLYKACSNVVTFP
jgi:mono/diheme cytochrome c family protein